MMASGGDPFAVRMAASEPRVPRNAPKRSRPFQEMNLQMNFMNGFADDPPNNYWDWHPSSTFMELPTQTHSGTKSKNKNKEQGTKRVHGTPPREVGQSRKHTPATYPRTKYLGGAQERADIERLRQQLTFSDAEEPRGMENGTIEANMHPANNARIKHSHKPSSGKDDRAPSLEGSFKNAVPVEDPNPNEMPNRNQIVARLMQIREYIKQASAMLTNIDGAGEGLQQEQYQKLSQLQEHLKEQERGYLTLLEKILGEESSGGGQSGGRSSQNSGDSFATSAAESASINVDAQSDISEVSTNEVNVSEQIEALEGLQQQHDLLKKMLQQQEELRALQNRQAALVNLQREIEGRLEVREIAQSSNDGTSEMGATEQSETQGSETTTATETSGNIPVQSEKYKAALKDLRRRTLLRMLNEDKEQSKPGGEQQGIRTDLEREQEHFTLMSAEHRELQDKLEALQQKKQQMDDLLQQLHTLRPDIPNNIESASEAGSVSTTGAVTSGSLHPPVGAGDAEDDRNSSFGSDSLRKLQEVRHRLTELRDLVQDYQETTSGFSEKVGDANGPQSEEAANYEDPDIMVNLRRLEKGELIGRFTNTSNQATTQTLAPPLINQSDDGGTPSVTEDETETETEAESEQSSTIPQAWADDPEIKEKVRKLETAKMKLRQLQDLVALVQQTPEVAMALPDDLAELATTLTEEYSEQNQDDEETEDEEEEGEETEMEGRPDGEYALELSEGEVPPVSEQTREAYYEAKMRQQRKELEKLMEERRRLMTVQHQLRELNQQLPPVNKINNLARQQEKPPANTVNRLEISTPSRDEVYAEMRRHKILQEELLQKKRELAALMAKVKKTENGSDFDSNDLDENDLFRVSMRSADVTAAATWGGSTQFSEDENDGDDDEDDDAYPSDGIVNVEEEEEQDTSTVVTSDTYTLERNDLGPRQSTVLPRDLDNDDTLLAEHGIRYPRWTPRQRLLNQRQENLRSAEELVNESPYQSAFNVDYNQTSWQMEQLQRQLQESLSFSQSLIRDQHAMVNILHNTGPVGYPGQAPPNGPSGDPRMGELLNNYNLRLQQQQLMLNLNSSYNELYKQQEALRNFYGSREGSIHDDSSAMSHDRDNINSNNNAFGRWSYQSGNSPYGINLYSPYGRPGSSYGNNLQYESSGSQFKMSPQFPPGFSQTQPAEFQFQQPHPVDPPLSDSRYLNQYDLYARQQAARYTHPYELSRNYQVPPNSSQPSFEDNEVGGNIPPMKKENLRPRGLDKGVNNATRPRETIRVNRMSQTPNNTSVPPLDINSLLKKTERQRQRHDDTRGSQSASQRSNLTGVSAEGSIPSKMNNAKSQAKLKMAARSKLTDPNFSTPQKFRPGLSSHLSGTAFLDTESLTSTMSFSSMPGELDRESMMYNRHGEHTQRSIQSHSEVESEAGSEFSLFEALRESIYSEVATLISQNETRPHFLIELFRELQMLNSDYLRQRALYALQDLVSKYLTEEASPEKMDELTGTYPNWPFCAASEHTPSESFFTSDEEEIKAQLYRQRYDRPELPQSVSRGSLNAQQYDYAENVDSASTMSTPPSITAGDFGFANDELGDTVIHLDKALQRMREYERMKAEAEASAGASTKQEGSGGAAAAAVAMVSGSDVTSNSSAQDMGSESSFSDIPYPRIDTRQLDLQIKSIMQEVIPYLKEHMDDVCSPQLLAYIRRLVMNLARQRDDSREFVRFFNRQLVSILEDSLSKFSGRKMRECGEDLLVDISEILFNELAFFRLMQDLDTAGDKLKKEIEKEEKQDGSEDEEEGDEEEVDEEEQEDDEDGMVTETTGTETGQEEAGAEEEGETTDNTTTDGEENDLLAKTDETSVTVIEVEQMLVQEAMEGAMAIASSFEAEELGNARDDQLASIMDVSDNEFDEDSEPANANKVKIELSMSESTAVNYIGSGEDDNERDTFSENEEIETSLGALSNRQQAAIDTTPDNETQDGPNSTEKVAPSADEDETLTPVEVQQTPDGEGNSPNGDGQVPASDDHVPASDDHVLAADDQVPAADDQVPAADDQVPIPDDQVPIPDDLQKESKEGTDVDGQSSAVEFKDANENEVTIEDLPDKLSLSQVDVKDQMATEQEALSKPGLAALETIVKGEEELAGDPVAIREPDGAPLTNGTSLD